MKQFISILLSVLFLASHMYLTIGTHYCGGEAVETKILFGQTHLGCGMMDMEGACDVYENPNNDKTGFNKTPCCDNEYQTLQSTNEFIKDVVPIPLDVDFVIVFICTTANVDLFSKTNHRVNTKYISPPLEKDVQTLFQSFLI